MDHTDHLIPSDHLIASIYKKYKDDLMSFLISYTHNVMDAEDILQDLFLKVLRLDVINEMTAKNLLLLMARRMAIDYARHKAYVRIQAKGLAQTVSQYDADSVVRRVETHDLLLLERRHLAEMAPKRAQVYELYRHQELSATEIARMLHLSKRTVETHIYLSSKDMRQYLRKCM